MNNQNWNAFAIGLGIASIIIGLLRVFIWEIKFMDTIELFIIGLAVIALSFSSKKVNKGD